MFFYQLKFFRMYIHSNVSNLAKATKKEAFSKYSAHSNKFKYMDIVRNNFPNETRSDRAGERQRLVFTLLFSCNVVTDSLGPRGL